MKNLIKLFVLVATVFTFVACTKPAAQENTEATETTVIEEETVETPAAEAETAAPAAEEAKAAH